MIKNIIIIIIKALYLINLFFIPTPFFIRISLDLCISYFYDIYIISYNRINNKNCHSNSIHLSIIHKQYRFSLRFSIEKKF